LRDPPSGPDRLTKAGAGARIFRIGAGFFVASAGTQRMPGHPRMPPSDTPEFAMRAGGVIAWWRVFALRLAAWMSLRAETGKVVRKAIRA
jgi:hypothetical protein